MILNFLLFVLGIAVLVKSADFFTSTSEKLGQHLGWSPFVIGLGILATGTSLPELITSLIASYNENSSVVVATVLGSNIVNVLLILGLGALLSKKVLVDKNATDSSLLLASTAWLVLSLMDGTLYRMEALLGLGLYAILILQKLQDKSWSLPAFSRPSFSTKDTGIMLLSALGIFAGAKLSLYGMSSLAEIMNVPMAWVALLLFALGTSLPELAVTLVAARKGKSELALGNILGSNVFNVSVVMGLSGLIRPLQANLDLMTVSLFFLVFSTLLVLVAGIQQGLSRWHGALFLLMYLLYVYHTLSLLF